MPPLLHSCFSDSVLFAGTFLHLFFIPDVCLPRLISVATRPVRVWKSFVKTTNHTTSCAWCPWPTPCRQNQRVWIDGSAERLSSWFLTIFAWSVWAVEQTRLPTLQTMYTKGRQYDHTERESGRRGDNVWAVQFYGEALLLVKAEHRRGKLYTQDEYRVLPLVGIVAWRVNIRTLRVNIRTWDAIVPLRVG